jgi:hypothetical protein
MKLNFGTTFALLVDEKMSTDQSRDDSCQKFGHDIKFFFVEIITNSTYIVFHVGQSTHTSTMIFLSTNQIKSRPDANLNLMLTWMFFDVKSRWVLMFFSMFWPTNSQLLASSLCSSVVHPVC